MVNEGQVKNWSWLNRNAEGVAGGLRLVRDPARRGGAIDDESFAAKDTP